MSSPPARRRRGEGDQGAGEDGAHDQPTAMAAQLQPADRAMSGAEGQGLASGAAAPQPPPPPQSAGVQPLPEQCRQGPLPGCCLHSLATVELQLCLQFLDSKSKLIAARCSQQLMQAAGAPFAWGAAAVTVAVRSAADVQRIRTSLLRFAPVQLCCDRMESVQCAAAVPHLFGLELTISSTAADLSRLLQHPNLARLQTIRLDSFASRLLTVDTVRLIARLPQLRSFDVFVFGGAAGAALLQPLSDAPALTELTIGQHFLVAVNAELLNTIGACGGLRTLKLCNLTFRSGTFLALCSSPSMRRLQHLDLTNLYAASVWTGNFQPPGAHEFRAAFIALEQLQSLTLERVYGINLLLPHLHRAPALRLLFIRCLPNAYDLESSYYQLPRRTVLTALLTAAPLLDVRLVMPPTLGRWMAFGQSAVLGNRARFEHQWRELQRMGTEIERVAIAGWQPPSA